jgi:hypothetical protein
MIPLQEILYPNREKLSRSRRLALLDAFARMFPAVRAQLSRWACSSVGRAPRSQRGGQGFEPPHVHHSKQTRRSTCGKRLRGLKLQNIGCIGFCIGLVLCVGGILSESRKDLCVPAVAQRYHDKFPSNNRSAAPHPSLAFPGNCAAAPNTPAPHPASSPHTSAVPHASQPTTARGLRP